MTNPHRDRTDIKHPEQLQQLQTGGGLALLRPTPRQRLPPPRFFRKSSVAFCIVRPILKEAWRAGAPSLSGNRSRDQGSDMRGGTELLQLFAFDTIHLDCLLSTV